MKMGKYWAALHVVAGMCDRKFTGINLGVYQCRCPDHMNCLFLIADLL